MTKNKVEIIPLEQSPAQRLGNAIQHTAEKIFNNTGFIEGITGAPSARDMERKNKALQGLVDFHEKIYDLSKVTEKLEIQSVARPSNIEAGIIDAETNHINSQIRKQEALAKLNALNIPLKEPEPIKAPVYDQIWYDKIVSPYLLELEEIEIDLAKLYKELGTFQTLKSEYERKALNGEMEFARLPEGRLEAEIGRDINDKEEERRNVKSDISRHKNKHKNWLEENLQA